MEPAASSSPTAGLPAEVGVAPPISQSQASPTDSVQPLDTRVPSESLTPREEFEHSLTTGVTGLVTSHGGPAKIIANSPEEVLAEDVGLPEGFRGDTAQSPQGTVSEPPTPTDAMLSAPHHTGLISMVPRSSVAMTEVIANQAMVTEVINNHISGSGNLGEVVHSPTTTPGLVHVTTDELGNPLITSDVTSPVAGMPAHFTMATPQRTNPIKGQSTFSIKL